MKQILICLLGLSTLLFSSLADARLGNGRSFGNRGNRGFSSPNTMRNYSNHYNQELPQSRPFQGPRAPSSITPGSTYARPSLLHSLGAGVAGGFLGGMLFRSLGGNSGYGYPSIPGGGIGPLEILLLGVLLFFIAKLFMNRSATAVSEGAADLMKQARPWGWSENPNSNEPVSILQPNQQAINPDLAMDLFFQVQGAWKNRNISTIENLLDQDAKIYLNEEISKLKANRQINCLENIAIRSTDIVEFWEESGKEYSTIHFTANLLDFTIDEQTNQIIEGSKSNSVKFEEFWTFSKEKGSPQWKLSAIQQP